MASAYNRPGFAGIAIAFMKSTESPITLLDKQHDRPSPGTIALEVGDGAFPGWEVGW